ncbi:MAG TPA: ribosome assembly cofactor RimP [Bacteroidia bacterium]|jgi:ribosome maturation factor RimP|nr:ribosome assembly cofactor RimP [Bacteroidia bacterium]
MINEQQIKALAQQKIDGTALFLVDVKVKPLNKIEVFIDAPNHVTVNECVSLSRHIEEKLNRDVEDFELIVSSPGIDQPFRVLSQYQKYLGKEVSVLKKDGIKIIGKLNGASDTAVEIETKRTERREKGKGRHTIIENITIDLNQIKETKLILPF